MSDESTSVAFLKNKLERMADQLEAVPRPEAVGLQDETAVNAMIQLLRHYPVDHPAVPSDPRQSKMFKDIVEHSGTHALRTAIKNDSWSEVNFWKGVDDNRVDATGYQRLLKKLEPAAQQILVKGAKGSGKTTKVLDLARRAVSEGIVDKVMMNIKTKGLDPEQDIEFDDDLDIRFAEDISDFLAFAKEPGEKLIVGDEWSTVANAMGANYEAQQIFPKVINALRKSEGGSTRLMYVGHNHDNDILPTLKHNSDVVIYAEGKVKQGLIDKVTVYSSSERETAWDNFKSGESEFKIQGLEDLPEQSPWKVGTNYFAHMEFDLDNPEEQIKRGKLVDGWERFQDGGSSSKGDEMQADKEVKCRGTNKQGERCGTVHVTHKSGYCKRHRDQWDEEEDGIDERFQE